MSKLKVIVLVLGVAGVSAAAVYWFNENPPDVTLINPARPPDPILEPPEVEKIRTLQETKDVYLLGPVSPDDASIIVIAGLDENSS